MEYNQIIQGDSKTILETLPDESVNCCVTSPPYWNLRDYSVEGQLGLEKTFEEYITKLCDTFDEVKRVLRKDGTCWVNLGDTYNSHSANSKNVGGFEGKQMRNNKAYSDSKITNKKEGIPDKSLCLIPQRFAIEMVNRGWILRNTIIWHKPNCMPSSAKDRFTVDFEYVYFFVKNKKYWFEQAFEELNYDSFRETKRGFNQPKGNRQEGIDSWKLNPQGRNKRAVWTIPTRPFPEAHFAVYPEALIEPMIQAGCPKYVCKKCGKAREKIIKPSDEYGKYLRPYRVNYVDKLKLGKYINHNRKKSNLTMDELCEKMGLNNEGHGGMVNHFENGRAIPTIDQWQDLKRIINLDNSFDKLITEISGQENGYIWEKTISTHHKLIKSLNASYKEIGYTDCGCNAGFEGGIVLDPFIGAGTTAVVAKKQGKRYIGIEIKQEYIDMANKRIRAVRELLF